MSRCVFSPPPYPVLFPWKSQGKVKEPLAASQPRDRPTTLARDDARNVTTHCTRRIVSGCLPCTQPTSALSLMRRHYSTSRERETCFFHDNYPSPPGGKIDCNQPTVPFYGGEAETVSRSFRGLFEACRRLDAGVKTRESRRNISDMYVRFGNSIDAIRTGRGNLYLSRNIDETRRLYNVARTISRCTSIPVTISR